MLSLFSGSYMICYGLLVNLCYNSKAFKSIYVTTTKPPRVTVYWYVMMARPPQVY